MINKLKKIKINGESYLAEFIKKEDGVELKNAIVISNNIRDTFNSWIRSYNLKELDNIFTDLNSGYSCEELDIEEKRAFKILLDDMDLIKEKVIPLAENMFFKEFICRKDNVI